MSSIEFTGLDKLEKQLKKMEKELSQTKNVPFEDLFTASFMNKYTSFSSMDELLDAGGFKVESQEDFEAILDAEFDKHISANTKFDSWEEMLDEAISQYFIERLGF